MLLFQCHHGALSMKSSLLEVPLNQDQQRR